MIESMREIRKRWLAEGRTFRPRDVSDEWNRQGREVLRKREDAVLAAAQLPDADERTRELAALVQDHRAAGRYTTQG